MAAIDLRSTTIFINDGSTSSLAGAINNVSGYAVGSTILTVDGFTGAVSIGQHILIGTHIQFYVVMAHTETGGNTTSITVFPPLVIAAVNDQAIDVVGHAIYAKIGEGNLTYSEKRNLVYIRDRGLIDTVKIGDDQPMDVSMDFTWEFLRAVSGIPPTFEEALKRIGEAASWTSTSDDSCAPYSVDITILDIPPCGSDAEKIILPDFRWESLDHDLKGAKVSIKGTCNVLLAIAAHSAP